MTIYIALLRGINVGGKKIVKMAALKQTLEAMGLSRVQTYIQSGNVLFESDEPREPLRKRLEQEIEAANGFPVTVVLRTAQELRGIAANCPFTEAEISEAEAAVNSEVLYISFLLEQPAQESVERLLAYTNEVDEFRLNGLELYLLFRNSMRNSKLADNLPKLKVASTMRNRKTLYKLIALADAMENG